MVSPSLRSIKLRSLAFIVTLAVFTAVACSGDDEPTTSSTTDGSSSSTSEPESTTTTGKPDTASAVATTWTEAWTTAARADAAASDVPGTAEGVAERIVTSLHPERADPATVDVSRSVTSEPNVTESAEEPDTYVIDDCLLISPAAAAGEANYYRGTATIDADGAVTIESVEPVSLTGCVSESVASDVLAAYEDYWTAVNQFSNPPDPDSARLAEVASGGQRDLLVRSLTDFKARGLSFVDDPGLHPEIIEWRNATTVVVLDCQEADAGYGLFDADGNRQPDPPPVAEGEVDLREFTMVLEDGRWKVTDRQGSSDTDCSFAPTEFGALVVRGRARVTGDR